MFQFVEFIYSLTDTYTTGNIDLREIFGFIGYCTDQELRSVVLPVLSSALGREVKKAQPFYFNYA